MRILFEAILTFISIGFASAVIRPIAKRWVQRRILKAAPMALKRIDAVLPDIIKLPSPEAVEGRVREILEEVTGESWEGTDLGLIFELFDLRKAVTRQ